MQQSVGVGSPQVHRPLFKELTNQENLPLVGSPVVKAQSQLMQPLETVDSLGSLGQPAPALPLAPVAAEDAGVTAEEMWRSLSCGICSGWIASSLVLSCGHSFCGTCLYDWINNKPSCPACTVGLRAVPVRSLALDAAVGVFERLLPEGERVDLRNRIESGRSAVNKMVKMLWWLQPPLMPALGSQGTQAALGTQDNHRPDAAAGGGGSSHTGHHHQQRDQQPSQSHQSRNEMSRRSSGGASLPPAVPQVTSRSHSFSGGHPHLGHNHSAGGPHGSSNSFSGGGHPFSSSNSFSNNGSSSGGDGSFTRQSSSAGHGGPRRSSPGPVPQGSNAWRQAQQHQQHQFVPQQQVQQQQQYQQVEPLRSNNRSMSMPLADPMPFLGLQHQLPVLFPPALSHQHQQEQAALLQRLTELGPYAPSGRSSQSGFELPLQHSYGQLTMGGAQDSLDLPPLEGACNSGLPLDLEQHSFSHGDAAGLPLGMQAEVLNMLRNIYLQ